MEQSDVRGSRRSFSVADGFRWSSSGLPTATS